MNKLLLDVLHICKNFTGINAYLEFMKGYGSKSLLLEAKTENINKGPFFLFFDSPKEEKKSEPPYWSGFL